MGWGLTRFLGRRVAGVAGVATGDLVFAVLLSLSAALSAAGITSNSGNPNAGPAAAVAVLLMSAPVLLARAWPLAACAVLAVGAGLNWLVIGDLVRCGAGLIAVFYVAFVVGLKCRTVRTAAGMALLSVNVVCQAYSDPKLGAGAILLMIPVAAAFAAAGRLVASRNATVAALRANTAQLRHEREENARLAVATEHARIVGDLDGFLAAQVDRITDTATSGRASLAADPEQARAAFTSISQAGRAALVRMREVVSELEPTPEASGAGEPAPTLAQLDRLLADATESPARLEVIGDPRVLAPGLELSVYRIVERLLEATGRDRVGRGPRPPVAVTLQFCAHELRLTVTGAAARRAHTRAALAAAQLRASVHRGSVHSTAADGIRTTVVALPLTAGHG